MATEIEARLRISAQDRTAKAFQSIEQRLKKAEGQAKRANHAAGKIDAFERASAASDRAILLAGGALGAGLAAAGGVRAGLDTLTAYQNGLIAIQKKAGLTEAQMAAVGKEARALATSGELAVPLEEILSAYERGAAAGLPLEDLKDFARLSAKAADAFEMSAQDVGNAAAGFKVGLGISMTEMERYFDLINTLADSGISDERDIINFLDRAGASLKNFGLNAQQAAAYGATLLNLKIAPETGARMMGAMTSKLIAPENLSDKAYDALKEVVGSIPAFKKALKQDAQGALVGFLEKLDTFDKFKRARVAGALFGQEWSDEVMRLTDGLDELKRNLGIVKTTDWFGSLDKSYQLKLDSLTARWQVAKNQMSELVIEVGVAGLPVLEGALKQIRTTLEEVKSAASTFGDDLDLAEIEEARAAVSGLLTEVRELLGLDTQDSQIRRFFKDVAGSVNEVARLINTITPVINYIANPEKGVTVLSPEEVEKRKAEHQAANPDGPGLWERIQAGAQGFADSLVAEAPAQRRPRAARAGQRRSGLVPSLQSGAVAWHGWMQDQHHNMWAPPPDVPAAASLRDDVGEALADISRSNDVIRALYGPQDDGAGAADAGAASASVPGVPQAVPTGPDDLPAFTAPVSSPAPLNLQLEDTSLDALRVAIEGAGPPIEAAGASAGQSILDAARALEEAAVRIGEEGRRAAEAISSVRIQAPAMAGTRGANADFGQSMPTAGTPGGGS